MRFLKRQVINRRAPSDSRLVVDVNNGVVMDTPNSLLLPKGTGDVNYSVGVPENQRPVAPVTGMIRYNTTYDEVEVYSGASATWRPIRFREAGQIIQQDLGNGDFIETKFGPLNPPPGFTRLGYSTTQDGYTWTGSNIIVIVENVIQIFNTNYVIEHNPAGLSPSTGLPYDPGYYVVFDQPVPTGKAVTVLHGFDR